MSSTSRLRLAYSSGTGPASLVLKLSSPDAAFRQAAAFIYRCETRFYRDIAPNVGVRTPNCFASIDPDDFGVSALLLEDFPEFRVGDQLAGCTPAQAQAAAVNIAGLHAATWCQASLKGLDWIVPKGSDVPDDTTGLREPIAQFLDRYDLSPVARDVFRAFSEQAAGWQGHEGPRSLIHGDHRPDNLLFGGSTDAVAVVALDWQTVGFASPFCDLALLIASGLLPDDRRASERAIIDAYHQTLIDHGVTIASSECWNEYVHALPYALVVVAGGAYYSVRTERGDRMFTAMAERAAQAIKDLGSLEL
jgi:hypothetical protein